MPWGSDSPNENAMKTGIAACTGHASTRYLLDVHTDRSRYRLDFAVDELDLLNAIRAKQYEIFVYDALGIPGEDRQRFIKTVTDMKLRHLARLLLIVEQPPAGSRAGMQSFGPFALIEGAFSKKRLNEVLMDLLNVKDTGSRVKGDDKFFDVTIFKK